MRIEAIIFFSRRGLPDGRGSIGGAFSRQRKQEGSVVQSAYDMLKLASSV